MLFFYVDFDLFVRDVSNH